MDTRPLRRLPALVVWATALVVVAATSSAATMVITGKDIKDGTVTTRDVKNGSLKLRDLSPTTRTRLQGDRGPAGEPGQDGAPGQDGEPGAAVVGSPCDLPGGGTGVVAMAVANDGTISWLCDTSASDLDGDGVTQDAGDCNDADPAINPGAQEVLDGLDNDCDGTIDEGFETSPDADGDGYTVAGGDCNDSNPAVNPGAPEVVGDGIDNDCDMVIDEPQP